MNSIVQCLPPLSSFSSLSPLSPPFLSPSLLPLPLLLFPPLRRLSQCCHCAGLRPDERAHSAPPGHCGAGQENHGGLQHPVRPSGDTGGKGSSGHGAACSIHTYAHTHTQTHVQPLLCGAWFQSCWPNINNEIFHSTRRSPIIGPQFKTDFLNFSYIS